MSARAQKHIHYALLVEISNTCSLMMLRYLKCIASDVTLPNCEFELAETIDATPRTRNFFLHVHMCMMPPDLKVIGLAQDWCVPLTLYCTFSHTCIRLNAAPVVFSFCVCTLYLHRCRVVRCLIITLHLHTVSISLCVCTHDWTLHYLYFIVRWHRCVTPAHMQM